MKRLIKPGLLVGSLCSLLRANSFFREPRVSLITSQQQPKPSEKKKIVIIGGGIAGCSSAYFLNQFHDPKKIEIVLLEKENKIAQGSTYQNGRHAAANVGIFYPTPLSDLFKGYTLPKKQIKIYLNPMVFFEQGGFKFIGHRASILLEERCNANFIPVVENICKSLKINRENDLQFYEVLENKIFPKEIEFKIVEEFKEFTVDQIKSFCEINSLSYSPDKFPRFLQFYNSRIIESRIWTEKMLEQAKLAQNVELKTSTRVTSWIRNEKSGKIIGVKTEQGEEIYGNQFVIANGMETKFLTRALNLSIPMLGGKGYSLNLVPKQGKQQFLPQVSSTFVHYIQACFINTTKRDMRVTGSFQFTTFNDTEPTPEKVERLMDIVRSFYTFNLDDFDVQKWACLRPMTPDEIPIVGKIEGHENVFIHSGLGARGTNHSVMTGELLAAQMTGKEVPHLEEVSKLFSPNRFKSFL